MSQAIQHVSDTSLWVANYRAIETEREDAIFKDPFAKILIGNHSTSFANEKTNINRWTSWTVVMRTYIIDQMIEDLMVKGIRTFVNLGAGLDSRPYRMNLGDHIQWVEVDFPHVIDHKKQALEQFKPRCHLERIGMDLSDREERKKLFEYLAEKDESIVVLTEGVLPYLTEQQVSELSEDLMAYSSFKYWIGEYISPISYRALKNPKEMKSLSRSPFQFFPENWKEFFETRGWKLHEEKYYIEAAEKFGRPIPLPKIFFIVAFFLGEKWALPFKRMSGFLIWEKK